MEWDRHILLHFSSFENLIENYKKKSKSSEKLNKRAVVIVTCDNGLCDQTLKSILDQSIRVDDFAINTNNPENLDPKINVVATTHRPGTEIIREPSADTVIIYIQNGKIYPYDYIENYIIKNGTSDG